jgi:hypothetical protein
MHKIGFQRPGALLMLIAAVLTILFGIGPLWMALSSPTHTWGFAATGPQAFLLGAVGLIVFFLYLTGVIQYTHSKGYSGWVGFWLTLAEIPGFFAMLLLPDLYEAMLRERPRETSAMAV